jgi:tetratricopeptide (TPR) repeat protein
LAKTSSELFRDRISSIYEYDKKSPLFVRVANWEIEDNNTEKAIEILNEGLKEYPDYAAAHFVLGKAYSFIGEYAKALKSFKTGSELIHSSKSYDYYLRELENIKKQQSLPGANSYSSSFTSDKPDAKQENKDLLLKEDNNLTVDDRLGELAQEISQAKMFDVSNEVKTDNSTLRYFSEDSLIVSETLAKIYIAQGEFKEAVDVFEKLKKKHPEKKDYYSQKISEIKSNIDPPAAD